MNLENKLIWDLTMEEIRFLYSIRHLNEYVYYGAQLVHQGSPDPVPAPDALHLPAYLAGPAKKILSLLPFIGKEDPSLTRINFIYYSYFFFEAFQHLQPEDLDELIRLLSSVAWMAVSVERNDGIQLWPYPVIRDLSPEFSRKYELLVSSGNVDDFLRRLDEKSYLLQKSDPAKLLLDYIQNAVFTIITHIENNKLPPEEISRVLEHVERNMIRFEKQHSLRNKTGPAGKARFSTQIRYRGTLYLYGGRHFERTGDLSKAYDWYTREICYKNFPQDFVYYLTDFKQVERLLCAYRVLRDEKKRPFLKNLIRDCFFSGYKQTARYATKILDYLAANPGADLSVKDFTTVKGERLQYSGESVREVYLISLLYKRLVEERVPDPADPSTSC